jgi:hypothetical protein
MITPPVQPRSQKRIFSARVGGPMLGASRRLVMRAALCLFLVAAGCAGEPRLGLDTATVARHDGDNPNPVLFERDARPFGASLETWSERLWDWVYKIPAATNPLLDTTGADCAVNQRGPVWYLPSVIVSGGVASFTRRCTVPHERALLVNLSGVVNDFPCPDPTFKPAPGQSLYDFLASGAKPIVDTVNSLDVSLDGAALVDMLAYRVTSDDLFSVDGDVSLQTSLDGCITGSPQPAVSDGYFIMFKPLARGSHTVVQHLTDTFGKDVTVTYDLTVN